MNIEDVRKWLRQFVCTNRKDLALSDNEFYFFLDIINSASPKILLQIIDELKKRGDKYD